MSYNHKKNNYLLEFNKKNVVIKSYVLEVSKFIEIIFKGLLTQHNLKKINTQESTYAINTDIDGVGLIILKNGEHLYIQKNGNAVEVVNVLMNNIKLDLLNGTKNILALHAALVSYDGHSILLPGNSGNGKSLTTLGLLSLGCDYYTDEVILFDPNSDTHKIIPFVRPLMIKPHGLTAARTLIGDKIDDLIVLGESIHSIPIDKLNECFNTTEIDKPYSLNKAKKPPPIKIIIFPEYNPDFQGKVTKLSAGETVIELFKNNVIARNLPDLGTHTLTQLAQQVDGLKLQYGDYKQLPNLFTEIKTKLYRLQ